MKKTFQNYIRLQHSNPGNAAVYEENTPENPRKAATGDEVNVQTL